MTETASKKRNVLAGLLSFGPILAFVITYLIAPVADAQRLFVATAVFMAATLVAAVALRGREQWSLMPWIGRILLLVMGALTLWLRDEMFIKMMPSIQAMSVAVLAMSALLAGVPRPVLLLKDERFRMDPRGRRKMLVYLIGGAVCMALLNEAVWRFWSTGFWVVFQLWGRLLVVVLFAALAVPVFKSHRVERVSPTDPDLRLAE